MQNLEEIKRMKLEKLMQLRQEKMQQQTQEEMQLQHQIEYMENIVKQFFTKEALIRYGNLKTAHSDIALKLLAVLYRTIQSNQIKNKIDDSTLKKVLEQLTPKKKDINIKRI